MTRYLGSNPLKTIFSWITTSLGFIIMIGGVIGHIEGKFDLMILLLTVTLGMLIVDNADVRRRLDKLIEAKV